MKLYYILLLLLLYLFIIKCQNGFSSCEEQLSNTGFFQPYCKPDSNCYSYQIQNGFSSDLDFDVILECDKIDLSVSQHTLSAFSLSNTFCQEPTTGLIKDTLCKLKLNAINPCNNDIDQNASPQKENIATFKSSCGIIDNDDNNDDDCTSKCNCSFLDLWCQFSDGCWWHFWFPNALFILFMIICVSLIMLIIFLIPQINRLVNMKKKSNEVSTIRQRTFENKFQYINNNNNNNNKKGSSKNNKMKYKKISNNVLKNRNNNDDFYLDIK